MKRIYQNDLLIHVRMCEIQRVVFPEWDVYRLKNMERVVTGTGENDKWEYRVERGYLMRRVLEVTVIWSIVRCCRGAIKI